LIDYFAFKIWWCCLAPPERTISLTIIAVAASLSGFITKEAYETAWVLTGVGSPLKRGDAFVATYYLTAGVFDPSGEDPIDVYYLDMIFWLEFATFVVSPEADCSGGCAILNYS